MDGVMSQRRIALVVLGLLWAGMANSQKPVTSSPPPTAASTPANSYRAVVDQYCVNCHNSDDKVAGLALDKLDLSNAGANSDTMEKVVLKLRTGMMPPPSAPHPPQATRDAMV